LPHKLINLKLKIFSAQSDFKKNSGYDPLSCSRAGTRLFLILNRKKNRGMTLFLAAAPGLDSFPGVGRGRVGGGPVRRFLKMKNRLNFDFNRATSDLLDFKWVFCAFG
jgi:hypothetical protein